MMEKAIIYHNPRWGTSRKTLEVVKTSGVPFEIIEYLKTPPSIEELDAICQGIDTEPIALIRTKEKLFKELGLSKKDERSRQDWLKIMVENPKLIQRPIVAFKGKYALGRPPESVEEILK